MNKPKEFDLASADEIIEDYTRECSMIDTGNLFFAATEYKDAYAEAVKLIEEMAWALDKANYQGDYYDQKPHEAMEVVYANREAFEKYKQWKAGE